MQSSLYNLENSTSVLHLCRTAPSCIAIYERARLNSIRVYGVNFFGASLALIVGLLKNLPITGYRGAAAIYVDYASFFRNKAPALGAPLRISFGDDVRSKVCFHRCCSCPALPGRAFCSDACSCATQSGHFDVCHCGHAACSGEVGRDVQNAALSTNHALTGPR